MALTQRIDSLTIPSALTNRATTDPGAIYLRSSHGSYTFAQVDAEADSLAAALSGLGVEAGDRIALILPSCPEFVVALFAAARLGAIVVPLNPRLAQPELQYMLRHSEALCAVTIEQDRGTDFLQLFEQMMPQLPDLKYLVTVGEEDLWYDDRIFQYEDLVSSGKGRDYPAPSLAPDDFFALLYTSGTSGKPKGVKLSHANLLSIAANSADALGLQESDRVVGLYALFNAYGLAPGLFGTLVAGASVVLIPDANAESVLEAIEAHEATVHYGVPTLYVSELQAIGSQPRSLGSLRLGVISGAPVEDSLVERVAEAFDAVVVSSYSVTETASTVSTGVPGDTPEQRRFTVGRPLPGTAVRIVERTDGVDTELPTESVGEIRVRGPGVMLGYYRQPKETADSFDDQGFYRTGDLGILDEDGFLHLVGRTGDVIIRSGFNVYPREVESRIEMHPAVHEAAAIGVFDPLLGEAICACVVPVEGAIVTEHEIVDWCREALVEGKVPDQVRFVDDLPRTDTGQVRRVELARSVQTER